MLYLDYGRKEGDWHPNRYGGNENLEAVALLKRLNELVYRCLPDTMTNAEESTSWLMVSRPTYLGGLGFGYKWNMGWMHDTLTYMSKDPIHRKHRHHLTFGLLYAWQENFTVPLSHDEVVYGTGSLHRKMPGDDWQRFANLRLYHTFMYGHPGKKLLFMGGSSVRRPSGTTKAASTGINWRWDRTIEGSSVSSRTSTPCTGPSPRCIKWTSRPGDFSGSIATTGNTAPWRSFAGERTPTTVRSSCAILPPSRATRIGSGSPGEGSTER